MGSLYGNIIREKRTGSIGDTCLEETSGCSIASTLQVSGCKSTGQSLKVQGVFTGRFSIYWNRECSR